MLGVIDENIISEIFHYFPIKYKFNTFQCVSVDWRSIVWRPCFNRRLVLNFQDSTPTSSSLDADSFVQMELFKRCEHSLGELFGPDGIWSELTEVRLTGVTRDMDIVEWIRTIPTLERIELIRPDLESVHAILGSPEDADDLKPRHPNLKSIRLSEIELESIHQLEFLRLDNLKELVLNEVFLIKDDSSFLSSPTRRGSFDTCGEDLQLAPGRKPHCLERLDLYVIPFPELLNFLNNSFSIHSFVSLNFLKIRCLSSTAHADQLAAMIAAKVEPAGWPMLAELEVGIVTSHLVKVLTDKCHPHTLRRLAFTSRVDVAMGPDLGRLADFFPNIEEISFRAKSSSQLIEFARVLSLSNWKSSIRKLKISWTVVNSISVDSLVRLRIAMRGMPFFHAGPRMLRVDRKAHRDSVVHVGDAFDRFYRELCHDRIVCECDECAQGGVDESHTWEMAEEEWAELDKDLKAAYSHV